jgi:Chromate resistance exported protein
VTRERPKIDRIACPWLIRRFVDPAALFMFVAPADVTAVVEQFGAAPFDIEGVFWSHRGDDCTFDVLIDLAWRRRRSCGSRRLCGELTRRASILRLKRQGFSPRRSACRACMPTISNNLKRD